MATASLSRRSGSASSASVRSRAAAAACAWARPAAPVASTSRLAASARATSEVAPEPDQQTGLGPPQRLGDLPVARRLPRLPRQRRELGLQRLEHVAHPAEIGLRGAQLQFRLVPPLVEARDPCGLLEHPTARLGLGVDQLGDLPLADQRRRMRPGRGVRKQDLHVARARFAAVGAVSAPGVAGDAPHDLERIVVVEARRRPPLRIVERQRHLGVAPRRPRAGAREDHVLHAVAPHHARPAFAHHPAQRLQQVGLAAAVRSDHARQPGRDDQLGRIDEALEAEQAQAGELQLAASVVVGSAESTAPGGPVNRDSPSSGQIHRNFR